MQGFMALFVALLSVHESYAQLLAVDREDILRAHNHVHSLVSPTAANTRQLVSKFIVAMLKNRLDSSIKFGCLVTCCSYAVALGI